MHYRSPPPSRAGSHVVRQGQQRRGHPRPGPPFSVHALQPRQQTPLGGNLGEEVLVDVLRSVAEVAALNFGLELRVVLGECVLLDPAPPSRPLNVSCIPSGARLSTLNVQQ